MAIAAAGVFVLAISAATGAGAAPGPADGDQQQQLAEIITRGSSNPAAHAIAGASSGLSGGTSTDTVGFGPSQTAFLSAMNYGALHPDVAPPGADDWKCRPGAAHPEPVVLVHGTWENAYENFAYVSQPIRDAGYCVFTFNYGRSTPDQGGGVGAILPGTYGTGYIQDSSKQLARFTDRVLAATGAHKVNIVAHSQGGPMSRWYMKFDGGAPKVDHLMTFGATNHGTTLDGIGSLGRAVQNFGIDTLGPSEIYVGHAAAQQTVGSDFLEQLNAGGDTVPGVQYTVVGSRYDEVSTPYDSTFLRPGPGARVDNITLQDGCGQDMSDHLTLMYSPRVLSIILHTLAPGRSPNLTCAFNPWLVGGSGKP
ncbi:MAG: alpha/beta fold hydrolase [Nocardia sp.]|nr:alpha/beta fold hydrolase [Nocardia sp.]